MRNTDIYIYIEHKGEHMNISELQICLLLKRYKNCLHMHQFLSTPIDIQCYILEDLKYSLYDC